jgi:pilus assembly protein CpaB
VSEGCILRKWSPPSKAFAVLGVLFALAAFLLVRGYAARVRALDAAMGGPVPVAVAEERLARGTVLDQSMFHIRSYPSAYAPPGAVGSEATADGRVLLAPLRRGEPLTSARMAPAGAGPLAALVPAGFQAVPIPASLPPGSIRPGDRVDVIATFAGARAHAETVATGLQVLRVMRSGAGTSPGFAGSGGASSEELMLLVLVSPDQSEELAFARAFADFSVAVEGAQEVVNSEAP